MTQAFMTKVWGVGYDKLPVFGFSSEGARLNFLRASKSGDWVYVVGTKTPNTPEQLRGRILARVQLGRDLYDTSAVIDACGYEPSENELDERGTYRWPFALPVLRFESVDGQPILTDIVGDFNDGSHFATYALNVEKQIGPLASDKLLSLPTTDEEVPKVPLLDKKRAHQDHQAFKDRLRGRSGPGPSSGTTFHRHEDVGGYTYLFQFFNGQSPTSKFKIGYAVDWKKRLANLNRGLFSSLTDWRLSMISIEPFQSAAYAYNLEQHLLRHFSDSLVDGENEVVNLPDTELYHRAVFELSRKAEFLEPPSNAEPFDRQADISDFSEED